MVFLKKYNTWYAKNAFVCSILYVLILLLRLSRFLHLIISINIILDKYLMIYMYYIYINLRVNFFTNLNKQHSVSHVARCNVHAIQRNKY